MIFVAFGLLLRFVAVCTVCDVVGYATNGMLSCVIDHSVVSYTAEYSANGTPFGTCGYSPLSAVRCTFRYTVGHTINYVPFDTLDCQPRSAVYCTIRHNVGYSDNYTFLCMVNGQSPCIVDCMTCYTDS